MKKRFRKASFADRTFDIINVLMMVFILIVTMYPVIIMVSSSLSSAEALMAGRVRFLPVDVNFEGYKAVFKNESIWTGLGNSFFYMIVGTFVNMLFTILAAYPLSREDFKPRGVIAMIFAFTMWFSGGLIPTYILIKDLGMLNSRLAMIIPVALNVWNMVIIRTYFQSSISKEILEAAKIDGCSDYGYLWKIAVPLSKPAIAVVTLYYAVGHWNVFTQAYIYLQKSELFPIQVVLRDILLLSQTQEMAGDVASDTNARLLSELLKYAVVIISSLPLVLIYPFVQKYFVKGIMVGGVKG